MKVENAWNVLNIVWFVGRMSIVPTVKADSGGEFVIVLVPSVNMELVARKKMGFV